jgi:beta-hydroxylase
MFYRTDAFGFLEDLQSKWRTIREEFESSFDESHASSWPQRFVYTEDWKLLPLIDPGRMANHGVVLSKGDLERNRRNFPRTLGALEGLPGLLEAGFSRLYPGTRIHPHKGIDHTVLRCHIGVIVPKGCFINVGGQIREWSDGCLFLFDDTRAHEVWNESGEARVVLIMDFLKSALEEHAGRPLDEMREEHTPEEIRRRDDLEKRWAAWQKKYAEHEPEPDWDKVFDYEVEEK